jgi:hypothetical protein
VLGANNLAEESCAVLTCTGTHLRARERDDHRYSQNKGLHRGWADSLWIHDTVITEKNGKKHSAHTTTYGCKIHQFNNTFFAQSGYAGEDVLPVAAQAAREGATIEDKAIAYNRLMKPRIEMDLEAMRQGAPIAYQRLFGKGDPFEAAFFGVERGRTIVVAVAYKIVSPLSEPVVLQCEVAGCVQVNEGPGFSVSAMGKNEEVLKYKGDEGFWSSNTLEEAISKLLRKEMTAHPDLVGGKIHILYIMANGAHWIEHGRECPEIKPMTNQTPQK